MLSKELRQDSMKPHIWLSCLSFRRGQWACCTARTTQAGRKHGRVRLPVGTIYYGNTPSEAYKLWKDSQ